MELPLNIIIQEVNIIIIIIIIVIHCKKENSSWFLIDILIDQIAQDEVSGIDLMVSAGCRIQIEIWSAIMTTQQLI